MSTHAYGLEKWLVTDRQGEEDPHWSGVFSGLSSLEQIVASPELESLAESGTPFRVTKTTTEISTEILIDTL